VAPFFEEHGIPLVRVPGGRGRRYCAERGRREYEPYLAVEDIEGSRTRAGELRRLEWDDMDFAAGILTVGNREGHRTKSGRMRKPALAPAVIDAPKRLRLRARTAWVFETREGTQFGHNYRRGFRQIVKKAPVAHCTVREARRTFVSHLATANVNEAVVPKPGGTLR